MSLTGGKRKVNKSLKAWVTFVKKVQKEEKLSYKDAIHRAKVRKDKGEKWMMGGDPMMDENMTTPTSTPMGGRRRKGRGGSPPDCQEEQDALDSCKTAAAAAEDVLAAADADIDAEELATQVANSALGGGRRRHRTMRRSRGRGRGHGRTARRARGRASRRH